MVAVGGLVTHAVVGAVGTEATVEFFFFEQEFRGMDISRIHLIIYIGTAKNVVDALPLALVTVGAFHAICTSGIACEVADALAADLLEHWVIRAVVEVAGNKDLSIGGDGTDGVERQAEAVGNGLAERLRIALTTIATGGMNNKDVEGIARIDETTGIEDVTGGPHTFYGGHPQGITAEGCEGKWAIEQGNIDTSDVGGIGHQVFIAGIAQKRTVCQVVEDRIIFHFAEGNQIGNAVVAGREQFLSNIVQFAPITLLRPVARGLWQILRIVLALVMTVVEEVFTVQLHNSQLLCS